jgi:hypothetical protein
MLAEGLAKILPEAPWSAKKRPMPTPPCWSGWAMRVLDHRSAGRHQQFRRRQAAVRDPDRPQPERRDAQSGWIYDCLTERLLPCAPRQGAFVDG